MPTSSAKVYRPTFLIPIGIILLVISACSFCGGLAELDLIRNQRQNSTAQTSSKKGDQPLSPKEVRTTIPPCPIANKVVLEPGVIVIVNTERDCWSGTVEASNDRKKFPIINADARFAIIKTTPRNITNSEQDNKVTYYAKCSDGSEFERNGIQLWHYRTGCEPPIVFRSDYKVYLDVEFFDVRE